MTCLHVMVHERIFDTPHKSRLNQSSLSMGNHFQELSKANISVIIKFLEILLIMALTFNKQNLVYILVTMMLQKPNGSFVTDVVKDIEIAVNAYNLKNGENFTKISQSSFYNYFSDLRTVVNSSHTPSDSTELGILFRDKHPKLVEKFYKQFNAVSFQTLVTFLLNNDYLKRKQFSEIVQSVDDNLYFSFSSFLQLSEKSLSSDAVKLEGCLTSALMEPKLVI